MSPSGWKGLISKAAMTNAMRKEEMEEEMMAAAKTITIKMGWWCNRPQQQQLQWALKDELQDPKQD
jgi:hypothetical protein